MKILFEDKDLLVLIKPRGLSSEDGNGQNIPQFIREYLNDSNAYIGVLHRLDTAVGGVMVYAKTKSAAANISRQIQDGLLEKEYYAVIKGAPESTTGTYQDLLFKDSSKNKVFVVKKERKGVKRAELNYELLETTKLGEAQISLVKIHLKTGRSHKIRVQFASRKMPLLGDGKYGSKFKCDIALFSTAISFNHPITKEKMYFSESVESVFPFNKFEIKK